MKSSWLPQTNAVSLFSVPPQHFVKHRNYKLSLLCFVNITHLTIPRSEAMLYLFLFLIVRACNIVGTKWMNEYPPAGPSRIPQAIAFCRKIHVQLMKATYLQTNPILAMGTCSTPSLLSLTQEWGSFSLDCPLEMVMQMQLTSLGMTPPNKSNWFSTSHPLWPTISTRLGRCWKIFTS